MRQGGTRGQDDFASRVGSLRPFPHEIVALTFVAAGIVVLERLPVTYPRTALLRVWALPIAVVCGLALAIGLAAAFLRRRHGGPGLDPVTDVVFLVRSGIVLVLTLSVHFLLKSFIYLINPRVWDRQLDGLDQTIHLGVSPSIFLTTLLHNGLLLHFVDIVYSGLYFFILVAYTAILLGLLPPRRKLAFTAAFLLLWIVGMVIYIALPTWGPAFVFPDEFADTLPSMPNTATVQGVLFGEISSLVRNPFGPRVVRFGCVAAFPSLHVAVITLFALASRTISRRWFEANIVLLLVMVVGSVITGYHYLVDSYAGVILAGACWWAGLAVYERSGRRSPEIDTAAPTV